MSDQASGRARSPRVVKKKGGGGGSRLEQTRGHGKVFVSHGRRPAGPGCQAVAAVRQGRLTASRLAARRSQCYLAFKEVLYLHVEPRFSIDYSSVIPLWE